MKKIQFDGAAIPNPGPMGIGVVLFENDDVIEQISEELTEKGTNNVAEYSALIKGLERALELNWNDVTVEGDSLLVIKQINDEWKVKKDHLKSLYSQTKEMITQFNSVKIIKIPGEQNSLADHLACKALGFDGDPYHFPKQPSHDFPKKLNEDVNNDVDIKCPKCNSECTFQWQVFENGTRHIKQTCPRHGYVRYAPKTDFFKQLADKEMGKQQTLF